MLEACVRLGCVNKCLRKVRLICLVDLTIFACRLDLAMVKLHEDVAIPFATALSKLDDICYPALSKPRRIRYNDCLMELVDLVLSLLGKTQRKTMTPVKSIMKAQVSSPDQG